MSFKIEEVTKEKFSKFGVTFRKIYFAPEAPNQPSRNRKPSPQMILDAQKDFSINLIDSYMVGDKTLDIECGNNAGVKLSVLVRTGYGQEHESLLSQMHQPFIVVDTLNDFANIALDKTK